MNARLWGGGLSSTECREVFDPLNREPYGGGNLQLGDFENYQHGRDAFAAGMSLAEMRVPSSHDITIRDLAAVAGFVDALHEQLGALSAAPCEGAADDGSEGGA